MKISLRSIFVIVFFAALVFALVARNSAMNALLERWSRAGGGGIKTAFPILGWNYAWLGGASQSIEPQSIEDVNALILQITKQGGCKTLRLNRKVVESHQFKYSSDVDTLNKLLKGVEIDTIELIDWGIDSATVHSALVGMRVKHWQLMHSSSFK